MLKVATELTTQHVIENWKKDLEEGLYFYSLSNGDNIGYDYYSDVFSLNNYWNEISTEEAMDLYKKYNND